MKLVTPRTSLLIALAALATTAATASAGPVAQQDDGAYQLLGRVFPDPQGACNAGPCSPLSQGNAPATTFLGYQELIAGLTYMSSQSAASSPTWQRYMEVWTLDGDLGGNSKADGTNDTAPGTDEKANFPGNNLGFWEFTPDGAAHSAGLPAFTSAPQSDSGRVRSDVIVVRVTDENVPDAAKQRYALSLSIHGIERAGIEGGARALEDLVTAATTGKLDKPVLATKGLGLRVPSFKEVLQKTIIYFTFPNPDGWRRGDVNDTEKGPGVMFQRYNGNGVDLNRDFPDIGFSFRPYSGLSEPESRGWANAFRQIKAGGGPFAAGDDLHGMNGADSFSYTLLPHGSHDYAKNERIRIAAQAINLVQQDSLSWSPLIQPNDAPQPECASGPLGDDCPQMYGQSWGSVYDTINYTTTGALGDWMDSTIGLNADGIDNEMAYSHITKNIAFDPLIEQMHVDGNKGLIYAHLTQMLNQSRFVFPARGRKGFVATTRVKRAEKAGTAIPPGTRAQDDIDATIAPATGNDTHEFEVEQGGEIFNGGMRIDVTTTNVQGIDPSAAAGKTLTVECQGCDKHRGGEHVDSDESKWTVVASDYNQSGLYLQAGLTVAVNNPQGSSATTKWRARISGALPGTLKVHVDFTQGPATTDGATGGDDPPRLAGYDVAATDFWRRLDRFTVSGAGFTSVDADRLAKGSDASVPAALDSLVLGDQPLPGYEYPAVDPGAIPAPLSFASTRPTVPCAYGDGQPHVPTCNETFDFEVPRDGLGRATVTMTPTTGDLTLTVYKLAADGSEEQLAPTSDQGGDAGAETVIVPFPEAGKYRAYVDNWVAPTDSSWKATVSFDGIASAAPAGPSAYSDAEYARYAARLKAFVEGGGNLVLTDGALRLLPALFGSIASTDVSRSISYVGQVAFTTKETTSQQAEADGSTLGDPLAKNVARQGARFNSGLRRQTYEPTPIGFSIQDESGGDASNSPQWLVKRKSFEAAGGRIVATGADEGGAMVDYVTVGEIPLGKGVVRVAGALLPQPSQAFDHQEGLEPFAVTYTGYTLAENLTDWCRPGASCVDPRAAGAVGIAGSGATACIASRGFRSAKAQGRGKGLRFSFKRSGTAPVHVDLFQVSKGRRVLRERLIGRFAGRKAIAWNGAKRTRWRPTDGYYFARFRVKGPTGYDEYKRVALRRQNGRWTRQRQFFGTETCGLLRQAKLSRMVFGGSNRTRLGISYLLSRRAPVKVTVSRGKKVVARFSAKRSVAGKVVRRTLKKRTLPRGLYRVRIVAGKGKSAKRATLYSRKL